MRHAKIPCKTACLFASAVLCNAAMLCIVTVACIAAGCAAPHRVVTTASLLSEMTDLTRLAEWPDPPFTCRQFSSYDRKAQSPNQDWFANADYGQFIRTEDHSGRTEYVMMDATGPGAIVRIWSANPQGTLRVYLDGSDAPAIEMPMSDFLSGKYPTAPNPIACETSRGFNSYFPIPYATHCKVTSDQGKFYYHVNYRTYPPETDVRTFNPRDVDALATRAAEVAARLATPESVIRPEDSTTGQSTALGTTLPFDLTVPVGGTDTLVSLTGPGAIDGLTIQVDADDVTSALRRTVLRITFDGKETVVAPLGDFFGASPGVNPYASLPLRVTDDGQMQCRWFMPFRGEATVRFENTGTEPVRLVGSVSTTPYDWTDRSMVFHAKWRAEFDVPTRPMIDWNYLTARGRGVFVGDAFSIANPVKQWWGEGDEKIYVDGESFPSHFGTGTEDYFGYAWCSNIPFQHAYHNQPRCDGPGNYGWTSVNRWHILDRIPFTKSFQFDMELWHWNPSATVTMSVVAYWYAEPGATDGFRPLRTSDLKVVEMPPYMPPRVPGAIEGERMRVSDITGGATEAQSITGCSSDAHLWWRHGQKPGDRLELVFTVPDAGRYRVLGRFVKAVDYGVIQLAINGRDAGAPIDFFNNGVMLSEEIDLGTFDLTAGENQLTATIVSANDQAVKQYMFGLDYLRLESADR